MMRRTRKKAQKCVERNKLEWKSIFIEHESKQEKQIEREREETNTKIAHGKF